MVDRGDAREAADRLIAAFGSLAAIGAAPRRRLAALVGEPAAALVAAHRAAMLWALREPAVRGPVMATRYELIDYLYHRMAHDPTESLRVFFLNRGRELLAEEVVARGGPDALAVEPRQVMARALELGATGLILVHNHPSGDPSPSLADRRFTRALAAAGEHLGVRLHDHLIVARGGTRLMEVAEG
ncbi:JAB domain-containing protein [Sphingomonas rubra]|uniref:DNA repair protein RadC n=1 Tax=Sphingomonas rubra TaxID=634430 RepID=A0A1I5SUA7_9SPHN|nr:JAB domain-containing protein [Sphingomonas rubra]SFP74201.1 DNA repair protein RadC [Sphingomonas rubra]